MLKGTWLTFIYIDLLNVLLCSYKINKENKNYITVYTYYIFYICTRYLLKILVELGIYVNRTTFRYIQIKLLKKLPYNHS